MTRTGLALAITLLAACGSDSSSTPDGNTPTDGGPTGDAYVPEAGYTRLVGRTWTIPPGSADTYKCVRVTIPEDTYLTNIIAQAPTGTHHTVLSIASAQTGTKGPDGEYNCGVASLGMVMLYASGVGTSPLDFPADVGVKIPAGTQIHLNLHLFNASDNDLIGESAIWVKSQATAPTTLAEMVFAGGFRFQIPPTGQPHTFKAGCVEPTPMESYKIFALWPHMHVLATHSKFEVTRNGTTTVLHDDAYSFEEQTYWKLDQEFVVQAGDDIKVTCTWVNPVGNGNVGFGDSTNQEMCFTGMYRYPAREAGLFECTDTRGIGF